MASRTTAARAARCIRRHRGVGMALFAGLLTWPGGAVLAAEVAPQLLHGIFSDHVVLQRDKPVPVWGAAAGGETVTVSLVATGSSGGKTASPVVSVSVHADSAGHWTAVLPAVGAGGPFVLTATSSSGTTQTVNDVLSGDVFLCSGQSNMEMSVARASNSYDEIRNSANDTIRLVNIAHAIHPTPLGHFTAPVAWQVAAPHTVPDWSAVCFFFARELQTSTHVPVGLIHSSWGGANIRPWISAGGLRSLGEYAVGLQELQLFAKDPAAAQSHFAARWEQWWRSATADRIGAEPWSARPVRQQASGGHTWRFAPGGLGDWRLWGVPELASFTGALWYRTTVNLTASQAKSANSGGATLNLGAINQVDETWLNGHALGNTFGYEADRTYTISRGLLHAGENILVVNVFTTYGPGGLLAKGERRALHLPDGESVPLERPWQYRSVPPAIGYPPRAPWEPVGGLSTMYNAMIAPLGNYSLRGALWYQGESNTGEPQSYRALLQALMADWRRQFAPELPFLVVQLPNYGSLPSTPGESGWADIREAQRLAVAGDPHAGLAVTIDIGDPHNLHPTNKQDVARRLAAVARHVIYGESAPASGPVPATATWSAAGGPRQVAVTFTNFEGGLIAYSHATPIGFELCAPAPGTCRFVTAQIEGSSVLLSVPDGLSPTRVRYCWADSPVCTLADRSGLPAVPFELPIVSSPTTLTSAQDHERTMKLLHIDSALVDGDIAFRQHGGGHTDGPNWPTFLAFASRYIKGS
jgi:sialate O-acetylesterase